MTKKNYASLQWLARLVVCAHTAFLVYYVYFAKEYGLAYTIAMCVMVVALSMFVLIDTHSSRVVARLLFMSSPMVLVAAVTYHDGVVGLPGIALVVTCLVSMLIFGLPRPHKYLDELQWLLIGR